jgi:hypothetical protein
MDVGDRAHLAVADRESGDLQHRIAHASSPR